jgi:glyoxylase-like metal-dependent hydrolase (beta-lactamase superfamily II)
VTVPAPQVHGIPNGLFDENCWLVWDPDSRAAVVVDPGEESDRILAAIRERNLDVQAIWLTHGHLDHVWGVDDMRDATGAPAILHPLDRDWYDRAQSQALYYGITTFPALRPPDGECRHGDVLSVGPWRFEVRHVPGHSPGHVAFVGHGLCLSGDVLFLDSVGRTDLPGGDSATLMRSIREQLFTLPDDTRILPGHGPETTVGRERRLNPFVRDQQAPA